MKDLNILAGNATLKQLQNQALMNIKEQDMKKLNTHADNATIKQLQRVISKFTNGQYMKESDTLAELRKAIYFNVTCCSTSKGSA